MPRTQIPPPPPYSGRASQESSRTEDQNTSAHFFDYLHVLRKRLGVIITSVIVCILIAIYMNLTQRPIYESSVEVVLEPKVSDASSQAGGPMPSLTSDPTFLFTQIRLIQSPALAERTIKKLAASKDPKILIHTFGLKLKKGVTPEKEQQALVNALKRSISASPLERGSRILTIALRGYDPLMVKDATDTVAQSYVEINYEAHINAFKQSFSVISKSLAEIREKIKTGELVSKKLDSELQLLEALKIYGEKHPTVVSLSAAIPDLARQLREGAASLQSMEIGQRRELIPLLVEPHTDLAALSAAEADLRILRPILEQEILTNREMYNSLFKKLQEVELSGGKNVWIDASVVEPAGIPSTPVRPNKKMNLLLGIVAGFFLGAGLAYSLEYLDSSLRSLDDVKNYLRIFPLGMVPFVEVEILDQTRQGRWKEQDGTYRSYWNTSENSIPLYVSEAYRIIRTNLSFGSLDQELKVLQVTSAVKGEGKTTTVANLGISLAQAGLKTLLVDADMRRPSLDRIFGLDGVDQGLSNVLTGGVSWQEVIVPTPIPNLFCLTSGVVPPNPAELLSSKRLKTLIEEFREHYDIVVFDSPPVISVADSSVLASFVDGTLLVARAGFIPRHFTLQAKQAIQNVSGRWAGCILNSVEAHSQPYYHRYYGYHSYYGKEGEGQSHGSNKKKTTSRIERLQALKEPLQAFISSSIAKTLQLLAGEQPPKNKFPDASR